MTAAHPLKKTTADAGPARTKPLSAIQTSNPDSTFRRRCQTHRVDPDPLKSTCSSRARSASVSQFSTPFAGGIQVRFTERPWQSQAATAFFLAGERRCQICSMPVDEVRCPGRRCRLCRLNRRRRLTACGKSPPNTFLLAKHQFCPGATHSGTASCGPASTVSTAR